MARAFVSSTYVDLKKHRAYVIGRLMAAGIFVDPMEKWTAASDEPKELSMARVKDCHLCILLVGFRRGHIPQGDRLSITQMEYVAARKLGVDLLVFMADEKADWPAEYVAKLKRDAGIRRWRAELEEHLVCGTFTPQPESIDIDAALSRWFQDRAAKPEKVLSLTEVDESFPIEIQSYSNSQAVLVAWRTDKKIPGCLGFELRRAVLDAGGIRETVVRNRLGFQGDLNRSPGAAKPSTEWPIQNFRFADVPPEVGETRYRVVPLFGKPGALQRGDFPQPGDSRNWSGWTRWVSRRSGQTKGFRAFFNREVAAKEVLARSLGPQAGNLRREPLRILRNAPPDVREGLGGQLLGSLLGELAAAKHSRQRVFAAVSKVDAPEVLKALAALKRRLYLILGTGLDSASQESGAMYGHNANVRKELKAASAHVYDRLLKRPNSLQCNFAIFCDEWGTPSRVWTGSAAWTTQALCMRANNGILVESTSLARAYLDRWEDLRDAGNERPPALLATQARPTQISLEGAALTLWNTPAKGAAELRDVRRLIRGARQGVLFLLGWADTNNSLLKEILALGDEGIFVQGISCSGTRAKPAITLHNHRRATMLLGKRIDSTIVLIDAFGPHPVVITGSHNLTGDASMHHDADLLIVENAVGLAIEYAVHVIRLFDHYRFRVFLARCAVTRPWIGLQPDDAWQEHYFKNAKRTEFNFLFGELAPGL